MLLLRQFLHITYADKVSLALTTLQVFILATLAADMHIAMSGR